jgi:hypothetical protein
VLWRRGGITRPVKGRRRRSEDAERSGVWGHLLTAAEQSLQETQAGSHGQSNGSRYNERPNRFPTFPSGAPLPAGAGGIASEPVVPGPLETKGSGKPPQLGGSVLALIRATDISGRLVEVNADSETEAFEEQVHQERQDVRWFGHMRARVHAGGGSAHIANVNDDRVVPVLLVGVAAADREATT